MSEDNQDAPERVYDGDPTDKTVQMGSLHPPDADLDNDIPDEWWTEGPDDLPLEHAEAVRVLEGETTAEELWETYAIDVEDLLDEVPDDFER